MQSRIWRIRGLAVQGAALELSALHLQGSAGRIDHLASISCSHVPQAGDIAMLQQGGTAGTVRFSREQFASAGFFVQWEFSEPVEVVAVRFGAADGSLEFARFASLECDSLGRWSTSRLSDLAWPGARAFAQVSAFLDWGPGTVAYTDFQDVSSPTEYVDETGNYWYCTQAARYVYAPAARARTLAIPKGSLAASSNRSLLDFGAGDFTIQLWVRPSLLNASNAVGGWVISNDSTAGTRAFALALLPQRQIGVNFYVNQSISLGERSPVGVFDWGVVTHFVAARGGNTFYLFANGLRVASWPISGALQKNANSDVTLGSNPGGQADTYFDGEILGLRIAKGVCRWTADFAPPPPPNALRPWPLGWSPAVATVVHGTALGPASADAPSRAERARDAEYGGSGRIYGTTKAKGSPNNLPTKARVVLLHQRSKLLVRETWSDPDTGDYSFDGLDLRQEFLALAEDAAGNFRAVAAQRLLPGGAP